MVKKTLIKKHTISAAIPNSGGTAIPNSGGTAILNSGGTAIPNSGGTAIPNSGGTAIPIFIYTHLNRYPAPRGWGGRRNPQDLRVA